MKTLLLAASLALATALHAQTVPEPIAKVVAKYKDLFAQQQAAEERALEPAKTIYLRELEKLGASAKASGNLNGIADVQEALKAEADGTLVIALMVYGAEMEKLGTAYSNSKLNAIKQNAPNRKRLSDAFVREITDLERSFVRAGKVDDAKAAQELLVNSDYLYREEILPALRGKLLHHGGVLIVPVKSVAETVAQYTQPLEITYVVHFNSFLTLTFGATSIAFTGPPYASEVTVTGGPVGGARIDSKVKLPLKEWVTIKQIVTPAAMTFYIDGRESASFKADYSRFKGNIAIHNFSSTVGIKSVTIRKP